jgi:hypothetical protein
MGSINGLLSELLVLGCLRLCGSKTPMTMNIDQGIWHVNLVCPMVDATSDGTSIKIPCGCHVVVRWPWAHGGPRTLGSQFFLSRA